jgi:hypothetical protein
VSHWLLRAPLKKKYMWKSICNLTIRSKRGKIRQPQNRVGFLLFFIIFYDWFPA